MKGCYAMTRTMLAMGLALLITPIPSVCGQDKVMPSGDNGKAKQLFDNAESLRSQNKLLEAGKLFLQIHKSFPETDSGQLAGYRVGQCLVGLGNHQQALDYWQSFIEDSPSGPWRGQTQAAIIDLALGSFGDPALASKHAAEAVTALQEKLDRKAEFSWRQATFDIYLRRGATALAEGHCQEAADAFILAKQSGNDPKSKSPKLMADVLVGLDRLIEAAKERLDVFPKDLRGGDRRMAQVLAIGNIYNLARQHDRAKAIFDGAAVNRTPNLSRPLRSFAALGRARALAGLGDRPKAIDNYRLSLQDFDRASWHEETLRELALLVEQEPPTKMGNREKKPPRGSSRKQSSVQETCNRADALSLWIKLLARFPSSRHAPEALYHAGLLYVETDRCPQALECWERLVKDSAANPFAGEAYVQLLSVTLDRQLDLAAALKCAAAAAGWLDRLEPATAAVAGRSPRGVRPEAEIQGDIRLQLGLLAYLDGRSEEATARLLQAKGLAPTERSEDSHRRTATEIEQLIKTIRSGKNITPTIIQKDVGKASVALTLAGLYQQAELSDEAIVLCNRLIDGDLYQATRTQRSWALFLRGRSRANIRDDENEKMMKMALVDYQAAAEADPKAPWAASALYLAASTEWNFHKSADRAIILWQNLIQQYPESNLAARSVYQIAMTYQWTGRSGKAQEWFEKFIERYPDSTLTAAAQSQLKKLETAASTQEKVR